MIDSGDITPDDATSASVQFGWTPEAENIATVAVLDVTILPCGPRESADVRFVSDNTDVAVLVSQNCGQAVINGTTSSVSGRSTGVRFGDHLDGRLR